MMLRTTTLLVCTAGAALLAACGTEAPDPTTASPSSESPRSQEPTTDGHPQETTTDSTTPPLPTSAELQTAKHSGEWDLVLSDVRAGQQEGASRVVLDFAGTGVPGWSVEYVDEAVVEGSGKVVSLDGDAILQLSASGTTYPGPDGDSYSGPKRLRPDVGGVAEIYVVGTFEGYTQVFVGIDGAAAPFRVFALTDPSRLAVDIAGSAG